MFSYRQLLLGLTVWIAGAFPTLPAQQPLRNIIDQRVQAAWKKDEVKPAGLADDATFLRRVYLDLVGSIPTYNETVQFLADKSPDKRENLIDKLLDDPRFAIHQADVWDMVLFGRNPPGNNARTRDGFETWMQEQFAKNVPYDRWAKQLLLAEGNTVDEGAPMYLVQYERKPEDATVAISQTFLGTQLQCARCHDHPFESWTQVDFFGMAAFLARLQMVNVGKAGSVTKYAMGETEVGDILFVGPAKDQKPGQKGEPIKPKFLRGEALDEPVVKTKSSRPPRFPSGKIPPKPKFSRKDKLAEWIASPKNDLFARTVANRVWAQFMGMGIVNPVDNFSETNAPTLPELLDTLTQEMIAHKFDLKWYMRELCNSETYQQAATGESAEALPSSFERARTRPLSAEELIEAWRVANNYDVANPPKKSKGKVDRFRPLGSGYMLRFFGRPNNGVGDFQGGLHEHLYLNNGPLRQVISRSKGSLYDSVVNSKDPWERRIDRLFLSVLNRPSKPDEQKKFLAFLTAKGADTGERVQDAIWVLMTCSEFRFNH